jgi:hypothetical protein
MFQSMKVKMPQEVVPSFDTWQNAELDNNLRRVAKYTIEDVESLAELAPILLPQTYLEMYAHLVMFRSKQLTSHRTLPMLADPSHCPSHGLRKFLSILGGTTVCDPSIRERIVLPTYQKLIPIYAPFWKLSAEDVVPRRYQHAFDAQSTRIDTPTTELIQVIDYCMQLDLVTEAQMLLNVCLPNLSRATTTTTTASVWSMWSQLFELVRLLTPVLKRHNRSTTNDIAASYISTLLKESAKHLATSRPREPHNWSRTNVRHGSCNCEACRDVQRFLIHPQQSEGHFSYAEKIRKHLEYSFNYRQDFIFTTVKYKSPYTLVIRKTKNEYARLLQRWEADVADMRKQLANMRDEFMFNLLEGDIIEIAGLERALVTTGTPGDVRVSAQPLQATSSSAQNSMALDRPVAGMKRKADVIDLTEDGSV